ncbi:hypothetical protein [Paenibacillus thermotolerans]|uniref:hypothetical protein n=1 Tax=Paenibacillus thermotolerans TaxID=3027807 RepID=UPI002367D4F1|nr:MULTISPECIES: hypothetical protein [unclassified Paenibacillus]
MKKLFIPAMLWIIVALLAAACRNAERTDHIIAEARIDYDHNGSEETLRVQMVSGEWKEEKEPGAYTGVYWEGEFSLELLDQAGKVLHTLDLNDSFGGGPLLFSQSRSFQIAFEDYNDDGHPDFAIGQRFSSNGSVYNIYSLQPEGIAVIHKDLLTAEQEYSIRYEKVGPAVFKNRYYDMEKGDYVETLYTWQGGGFVRTECEGCGLSPGATDKPTPTDGTNFRLQLKAEKTADGFNVAHSDTDGFYVMQTLASPATEGVSYAVHIVRTHTEGEQGIHYRKDAVIVNPETEEVRAFPLYDVTVGDMYGIDSVGGAYGFLKDGQLLFVSAVTDESREGGYYYRVEKLNIVTGEKEVVFSEIPDAKTDDHFAPGWMNEEKNMLVLNSYREGRLWAFDLTTSEIVRPKQSFSHSWPFYLTVPSPDGERFWYSDYTKSEYRLHDQTGLLVASVPFSKGYAKYPAFLWSPDSRYAALQDTRDQSGDHIVEHGPEIDDFAPQRIRFYDREGKPVRTIQTAQGSGRYIELAGWLEAENGVVLLHEYELERKPESDPVIINSSYSLLHLASGGKKELRIEPDAARLQEPVPARIGQTFDAARRGLYWVDPKQLLITLAAENGMWLSEPGQSRYAWVTNLYGPEPGVYREIDLTTGKRSEKPIGSGLNDAILAGSDWLVWGDMNYTRVK